MPFTAILFDLDGVLALSAPAHHWAYTRIFRRFGITFTLRDFERVCLGTPRRQVLTTMLPSLVEPELSRLMQEKGQLTAHYLETRGLDPVPGALPFVRGLRADGMPVAVATASRMPGKLLAAIGASELFDAVVGGDRVEHLKPHPATYLLAAELLGVSAERCLVIEDSPIGVEAGKRAGARVLALTTTETPQALAGADWIRADLCGLDVDTLGDR